MSLWGIIDNQVDGTITNYKQVSGGEGAFTNHGLIENQGIQFTLRQQQIVNHGTIQNSGTFTNESWNPFINY